MALNLNRVSITMSQEDIEFLNNTIASLGLKMPFLLSGSEAEKKTIRGIDNTNKTFVEDVLKLYPSISHLLPEYLSEIEVRNDLVLFEQLDRVQMLLSDLQEKVKFTRAVAGAEAFDVAKSVYHMVKMAAKSGKPGAVAAYEQLKARFAKSGRPLPEEEKLPATN